MKMLKFSYLIISLCLSSLVYANTKLAVPDFELLDLTFKLSDPAKVAEIHAQDQKNLKIIEGMLRNGLNKTDGISLVEITSEQREQADKSIGYLFDCPKCSAELGRSVGSDYIVIGRHHKPTYLFSYLIVRVFDTKTNSLHKEFRSEIKGDPKQAIPGAVYNLIKKINKTISSS